MSKQKRLRIERRQQKRFKAEEGAYAALVNGISKLGQIKNISLLGLSFRYIAGDDRLSNDIIPSERREERM